MSSFNISVAVDLIRRHIDYDTYDVSGVLINSKKSSLLDFLSTVDKNEFVSIPGEKILTICPILSQKIIDLIVDLLQIFKDMFSANICLHDFNENHLVIMLDGAIPKLSPHVIFMELTESQKDRNIMLLGQIIENTVLANCPLLGETEEFLDLFRMHGSMNFELIIVHSVIVPICQKIDYFCNTHDFLLKVVKKLDSAVYEDILRGLEFPADWENLIENNTHLKICYTRREPRKENAQNMQVRTAIDSQGSTSVAPNVQAVNNNEKHPIMHALPIRKEKAQNAQDQDGNIASTSSQGSSSVAPSVQKVNHNGKLPAVHPITPVLPMYKVKQQWQQRVQHPAQPCKPPVNKDRPQYRPKNVPPSTVIVPSVNPSQLHNQSDQSTRQASKTVPSVEPSQVHKQSDQATRQASTTVPSLNPSQLHKQSDQATRQASNTVASVDPSQVHKQSDQATRQPSKTVPSVDPSQVQKQSNTRQASKTVPTTSQLHGQSNETSQRTSSSGTCSSQLHGRLKQAPQQTSSSGTGSSQLQGHLKQAPQQAQISKKKKYNRPGSKPAEEVMRYYRNSGTHGIDYSVKKRQVQYSIKALNVMLLHYFQKLLSSALKGLHRNKYLSQMETKPRVVR